ncbi:MAG: hypothetical protein HOV79_09995 [Hamadaea sp.]|nr:hypothetical protein [Hamadaea sp.]
MPRIRREPDLTPFFEFCYGIARRDQLVGAKTTDAYLRWRLETGQWQVILPSVYALFQGDLTLEQRAFAGQLHGGAASQITGAAALRFLGLQYGPVAERIHILVPPDKRVASAPGFRVIRTERLAEPTVIDGLRLAPVVRAVADTLRERLDLRMARALVSEAVQSRAATVEEFEAEVADGPQRGSADFRRAVADVVGGARSAPEAELRDLCRTSRVLPPVLWNPILRGPGDDHLLPIPDGWLDDVGLALEVDSREYHSSPEGWVRTLERHNKLTVLGVVVLHITPRDLRRDPGKVLALIERTYLELARKGNRHRVRRVSDRGA